jgi:hypothetical protein
MENIFSFLDVATDFGVDSSQKYNVSGEGNEPRIMLLYDLAARANWVSITARAMQPKRLLRQARPIVKKVVTREINNIVVSPLMDEARQDLKYRFREGIFILQDLIQREFFLLVVNQGDSARGRNPYLHALFGVEMKIEYSKRTAPLLTQS